MLQPPSSKDAVGTARPIGGQQMQDADKPVQGGHSWTVPPQKLRQLILL